MSEMGLFPLQKAYSKLNNGHLAKLGELSFFFLLEKDMRLTPLKLQLPQKLCSNVFSGKKNQ